MSRIKRLVRPESEPLNWKLALPILGLVACAAFYTHAEPAQASTDKPVVHRHHFSSDSSEDGYALVRDGEHGTNLNGDSDHWDEINAIKPRVKGEFLWFREGGKSFIVQDQDILAGANAAWAPLDKLGEQMDVYGRQMDVHGKKMEQLGQQIEASAAKFRPDEKRSREFERKMNALGRQMEKLGERYENADGAERDRLNRQMSELGRQMGDLGRKFGKEQESEGRKMAQATMDDTGRRMNELSVPMNELGSKMGALGKEMERESKAADKTVRQLIREAQAKGLARPAPLGGEHKG